MSVGAGIFLGSVYLGTIYLYVHTRDRWDWSQLIRRGSLLVLLASAVIGGGLGALAGHQWWQDRPRAIVAIGVVKVGEPWLDVVSKLGDFREEEIRSVRKYPDERSFRHASLPLTVIVRTGTVHYVVHHCSANGNPMPLNGIGCGDEGVKLFEKFGARLRVLCQKNAGPLPDGVYGLRVFDVPDYGTRYVMRSNKVAAIAVASSEELRSLVGYNWDKCGEMPRLNEMDAKRAVPPIEVPVKGAPGLEKKSEAGPLPKN
jgi:hypothetical protein